MNQEPIQLPVQALIQLRQRLHQYPETAGTEKRTARILFEFLQTLPGWELTQNVGGHGLIAIFHCPAPGKTILFRAELDGLPQRDVCGKSWQSQHPGNAHACGHDGHMAILAGLAEAIRRNPPASGTIMLLFQPAEEIGTGASSCITHPLFKQYVPDFVFALHNIPGQPIGRVIVKEGGFSASVKSVMIRLHGKVSHAAEPELGINPAFYIAELLNFCKKQQQIDSARNDFFLITPTFIKAGEPAHGTAAGDGEIHLTFRAWTEALMEKNIQLFLMQLSGLGGIHKVRTTVKFTDVFPATNNEWEAINLIKRSAQDNHMEIFEVEQPFRWGEDFGVFTRNYKGAMFGIGAGENCPVLHSTDYDFPDELIEGAVKLLRGMI